jgi:apolipoprotein N-acyltransferase
MVTQVRKRFWILASAGSIFVLFFVATLVWPNWLELIVGVDPDYGNGTIEWVTVTLSGLAASACFVLARMEWRRADTAIIT